MAAAQTQFEIEPPETQQKFEIEPPAATPKVAAPQPGWLDKEIPLDSYSNATLSGVQSVGKGFRSVGQGLWGMIKPPSAEEFTEAAPTGHPEIAIPVRRAMKSIGELGKQAIEVPAAIHDINQSDDPLGHYAKAAQDMAGEGAAQAITAVATEGAGRAAPKVRSAIKSPTASKIAQTAKIGAKAAGVAAEELPVVGSVVKGGKVLRQVGDVWKSKPPAGTTPAPSISAEPYGPIATPEQLNPSLVSPSRTLPGQVGPERIMGPRPTPAQPIPPRQGLLLRGNVEAPAIDFENVPFAGEEGVEPRSVPRQQNQNAIVYRARDVGEQGVPYRNEHAQATRSRAQAEQYAEPGQRDAFRGGAPQEAVGIDLSQAPGFSVTKNNPNWIKFHGEVPESAISKVGSEAPAISTGERMNQLGSQIEQGLGGRPLKPDVPLRQQNIPEGMTPHESSATQAHRYNPQTNELEIYSGDGKHYVYGDVSPETAAKYEGAKSKGKAWSEIKQKHPLVAKVLNGKRVSVTPER